MGLQVLESGLMTTIQDLGRFGFRSSGVPVSGAMDKVAATIANKLIGNLPSLPVLEISYGGCQFYTTTNLLIACCGGGATLTINDIPVAYGKPIQVPSGSLIQFTTSQTQLYTYLAVQGGWKSSLALGSHSTYLPASIGGYQGRALQKGDILHANTPQLQIEKLNFPKWRVNPNRFASYSSRTLRIIKGHEYDWFTAQSVEQMINTPFTINRKSNRMGYSLDGIPIHKNQKQELLSTAVTIGTIQVTSSGQAIILMADCQTTGGYPRIGQIAAVDIPVCAQLRPGEQITFEHIEIEEAEALYLEQIRRLSQPFPSLISG